jgi:hypothetical protein
MLVDEKGERKFIIQLSARLGKLRGAGSKAVYTEMTTVWKV